jgi:hypothetical protein
VTITLAPARRRAANAATIILLTMSLGVLIAQIDTSVVNLAVKHIGADFNVEVNMLQWVVDAYNLVYASLLLWPERWPISVAGGESLRSAWCCSESDPLAAAWRRTPLSS